MMVEISVFVDEGTKVKVKCPYCDGKGEQKFYPLDADEMNEDNEVVVECNKCNGKEFLELELYEEHEFFEYIDEYDLFDEPPRMEGL